MSSKSARNVDGLTPEAKKAAQQACAKIASLLQEYQKILLNTKERVKNMKGTQVSAADKFELDQLISKMKESETIMKDLITSQLNELANVPPPAVGCPVPQDVAQFRTVVSKLSKDFEKAKQPSIEVYSDARLVRLDPKEVEAYTQLKEAASSKSNTFPTSGEASPMFGSSNSVNSGSNRYNSQQQQQQQQSGGSAAATTSSSSRLQLVQEKQYNLKAVNESVDETIINERCSDIEKIHTSTVLLNEMFVDLSKMVESQGEAINEIAANTADTHAKTEAGLDQLHQAEKLQRSGNKCIIC